MLFVAAGFLGGSWDLLLWSCLTATAQIRIGFLVTWILGWIVLCKCGSMDFSDFWTKRLYPGLDH